MKEYLVTWEINIEADSPVEAAKEAWRIMRRTNSTANVFTTIDADSGEVVIVDLEEYPDD